MKTSMSWFNLFRFDGDGGDGGDGKAAAAGKTGAAHDGKAAAGGDGKGGTDAGDGAGDGDLFKPIQSQKDLDRVLADRLRRQKEQFKDYDDLKDKATKFDELTAAQQTELEKEQAARAAAEQKAETAIATANKRYIVGEVKGLAGGMKFIDADDAYALVTSDPAKYGEITVDDAGNVVGAKDALVALVEAKPHLVDSGRATGDGDGGARGGGGKTDFREAEKGDLQAELAKHGLRTRT